MTSASMRRALCALIVAGATAAGAQPRVYANTCTEDESGDVDGYVVTLDGRSAAPDVRFQWSEGPLMEAVAAEAAFDAQHRRLSFTVHAQAGEFGFSGRLVASTLTGSMRVPWDERAQPVVLHRRPAALHGAPIGRCAAAAAR